jgi:hypothetical protein
LGAGRIERAQQGSAAMRHTMLTVIIVAVMAIAPATATPPQFKGLDALSSEISARIAATGTRIELADFLPADGLDDLMGTWKASSGQHHFHNGSPGPINIVLFSTVMSEFAERIGSGCVGQSELLFNAEFAKLLQDVCDWPIDDDRSDAALGAFWGALMGYNAPRTEYEAWRAFALGPDLAGAPAPEAVEAITLSIALNPWFLLQQ